MTTHTGISTAYGTFSGPFSRSGIEKSPLLIFLHGFPDDHRIWDYQIEALNELADLWAPNIYSYPFESQVKGLLEIIKKEKAGRDVILVAHDMGGPVACEIVRQEEGLIQKLLLINTFSIEHFIHRCRQPKQFLKSSYMPWFSGPLHKTEWWKILARQFVKLAYNKGGIPADDPVRKSINPDVIEGIKRYREIGKELPQHFSLKPKILNVETHFLFGTDDPFIVPPKEEELVRFYRLATLDFYYTGHWPQRTYSEDVNDKIKKLVGHG